MECIICISALGRVPTKSELVMIVHSGAVSVTFYNEKYVLFIGD